MPTTNALSKEKLAELARSLSADEKAFVEHKVAFLNAVIGEYLLVKGMGATPALFAAEVERMLNDLEYLAKPSGDFERARYIIEMKNTIELIVQLTQTRGGQEGVENATDC